MEDQGADARCKQCHTHVQACQDGDQDGGAGHGEGMLEPQQRHLPGAELRILLAGGEEQLIELGKDVHSTSSSFFCRGTEHTVHAAIYKNLPVFPPYVKIKNDIFP